MASMPATGAETAVPAVSVAGQSERLSPGKSDRLPLPETAEKPSSHQPPTGLSPETRVERAFADISRLEVALQGAEPPALAMALRASTAVLDPGSSLLAANAAGEHAEAAEPSAGPSRGFALALADEQRPLADRGSQAWTGMAPDSSVTGSIPTPGLPSDVPVPTPRPVKAPVAVAAADPRGKHSSAEAQPRKHEAPSRQADQNDTAPARGGAGVDHGYPVLGPGRGSPAETSDEPGEADVMASAAGAGTALPAPRASERQVALPASLLPEGPSPAAAPAPMEHVPGTPQEAVAVCGIAAAKAARAHGQAEVTAISHGPTRRLAGGGYSAPVVMRVTYELPGGQEVRQAAVWCHFDRQGEITQLREMAG